MGLEKQVIHKGANVTYWKIGEVRFDYLNNLAYVLVQGYINKDVRDFNVNEYMIHNVKQIPFGLDDARLVETDDEGKMLSTKPEVCKVKELSRSDMYTYLKSLDEFEGAKDVYEEKIK
jgi:hypothetical protein